jgi:RNA polymerase sigma factor (sigma-70 family)
MTIQPDIFEGAKRGDRKAQYVLYRQCFPVLMAVCARYRCGEQDAVAAINQAFLKIIQHLERLPSDVPFEAWIRRIQINVLIDEFRRNKNWQQQVSKVDDLQVVMPYSQASPTHNEGALQLEAGYIERLLMRLPPITRQVFNLFALDGYSHAEIGEMLGMSDGTSKWHVSTARSQLKIWLSES